MTVVDWSDKHKINALEARIKIMTANADEREREISQLRREKAQQARTIAELFSDMRAMDERLGRAMARCVAPERKQDHQQESTP